MSGQWKRFSLASRSGDLPALLYKYIPTTHGYELYMTDLTNIWSEHMTHQAILNRADEDEVTIDPSEDPEQFEVLLQKIGDALQRAPETHASLLKQNGNLDTLKIITSTRLPPPLEPLIWKMSLFKEPRSSTTNHLLLPLVQAEAQWEAQQQNLIDQLVKKDWVLGKLFDRIEAVGMDLTSVFPGMSGLRAGRRGTTLEQAAKYIKGVAPFDEKAWLDEAGRSSADTAFAANILSEIGRSELGKLHAPPDAWWEALSSTPDDMTPPHRALSEKGDQKSEPNTHNDTTAMDTDSGAETEDDDDEFERQETPPRLKRPIEKESPASSKKEEQPTDEESRMKSPLPSRRKVTSKPAQGLGMIGGKSKRTRKPSPKPTRSSSQVTSSPKSAKERSHEGPLPDEDETESGSDQDDRYPLPSIEKTESRKVSDKPRGLGVIGGNMKAKQVTPAQPASPQPSGGVLSRDKSPEKPSSPEMQTKRASKLGLIGGKTLQREINSALSPTDTTRPESEEKRTHSVKPNVEPAKSTSPERKPKMSSQEPKQEETEEERADRKREELKRQLEAKAKAPAKKKRRF